MLKAKHPIPWSWQEENAKFHHLGKPSWKETKHSWTRACSVTLHICSGFWTGCGGEKEDAMCDSAFLILTIWATNTKWKSSAWILSHLFFNGCSWMWEYATDIPLSMGFWMPLTWQRRLTQMFSRKIWGGRKPGRSKTNTKLCHVTCSNDASKCIHWIVKTDCGNWKWTQFLPSGLDTFWWFDGFSSDGIDMTV